MSISEEEFEQQQQQKCIFQKRGSAYWGFHFMVDICFSLKRFLSAWRGVSIFPSIPLHLLEWRDWDLGILERFHALTCFSISFLYYKDEYVSLAFCKIIQTLERTDSLTPKKAKIVTVCELFFVLLNFYVKRFLGVTNYAILTDFGALNCL